MLPRRTSSEPERTLLWVGNNRPEERTHKLRQLGTVDILNLASNSPGVIKPCRHPLPRQSVTDNQQLQVQVVINNLTRHIRALRRVLPAWQE